MQDMISTQLNCPFATGDRPGLMATGAGLSAAICATQVDSHRICESREKVMSPRVQKGVAREITPSVLGTQSNGAVDKDLARLHDFNPESPSDSAV